MTMRVTELVRYAINDIGNLFYPLTFSKYADIGTIYHALILRDDMLSNEIPANIELLDFKDYKTKEAREARDEAYCIDNKIPILKHEFEQIKSNIEESKKHAFRLISKWHI